MKKRGSFIVLFLILFSLGMNAQTLRNVGPGEAYSTIQAALNASNNFDTIRINVDGTHYESGITINKHIVIEGLGADKTTINGNFSYGGNNERVFTIIGSSVTVTIQDLRISNSGASNGVNAISWGQNGGEGQYGGAIYNEGICSIYRCSFYANHAGNGGNGYDGLDGANGGIGADGLPDPGDPGYDGGYGGNGGKGGAIANNGGDMTIENCLFYYNTAGNGGDGGNGGNGGDAADGTGNYYSRCMRGGDGGNGGRGGHGGFGGAISNRQGGSIELVNCTLEYNKTGDVGYPGDGGMGGKGGDATAEYDDGGNGGQGGLGGNGGHGGSASIIYQDEYSNVKFINCTATKNTCYSTNKTGSGGRGGMNGRFYSQGYPGDCGATGNGGKGGTGSSQGQYAIVNFNTNTDVVIINSLILGNTVSNAGIRPGGDGGYAGHQTSGCATIGNPGAQGDDGGYNSGELEANVDPNDVTSSHSYFTINNNPLLSLSNNGGPTLTIPIIEGSYADNGGAVNGVNAPTTDQRGFRRQNDDDAISVGAYEFLSIPSNLVINEVDAQQSDGDWHEFIELYDGGVGNTSLDEMVIVLYTSSDDQSYQTIDLTGYTTDENGYFVIGSTKYVDNVDLITHTGFLRNGQEAIALYKGLPKDYPYDCPVSTDNIIDAIIYVVDDVPGPSDIDDLILGGLYVDENENGDCGTQSMQRMPNGTGGQRYTNTYEVLPPTPGEPNGYPPTLTADPSSLNFGTVQKGTNNILTYSLTGSNLTDNVTVWGDDVNGCRVSTYDGGYNDNVILSPSNGNIDQTIYVQYYSGVLGEIQGLITNSSTGATTEDVPFTANVVEPVITVTQSSLNFGEVEVGQSVTMEYDITGTHLTNDIVITSPSSQYQVSFSPSSDFASSITLTESNGSASDKIYVKFAPTSQTTYTGNLTNVSSGATTVNIALTGEGVSAVATLSTNISSIDYGQMNVGVTNFVNRFTIYGNNVSGTVTIQCPTDVKVRIGTMDPWESTLTFSASGDFTKNIYVQFTMSSEGSYNEKIRISAPGATTRYVNILAEGVQADISTDPISYDFGNVNVGYAGETSYQLTGEYLRDDITITTPSEYYVSLTSDAGWTDNLVVPYNTTTKTVDTTVYVLFRPESEATYNNHILHTSNYANDQNLLVYGVGVRPTISATPGSLAFGDVEVGGSAELSYSLTAEYLLDDLTINPASGYQISLTSGSDFTNSLDLSPTGVDRTINETIYVRFAPDTARSFGGLIQNYSSGASDNVILSGTGYEHTLVATPDSIDFGIVPVGSSSIISYELVGEHLSDVEEVDIMAGDGFQVSLSAGGTFVDHLQISPDANSQVNTTVYIKFEPTAAQEYGRNINHYHFQLDEYTVISVIGQGGTPSLTAYPETVSFAGLIVGQQNDEKSFHLVGENLTNDIDLYGTLDYFGFYISTTSGSNYANSLTISPDANGSVDTTIYVYCDPVFSGSQLTDLEIESGTAYTSVELNYRGIAQLSVSPSNLDFGNVQVGTESNYQSFLLQASNLKDDESVVINAPEGFLISTGSTYTNTLEVIENNNEINININVKFVPTTTSNYNDDIVISGDNVVTNNVAVTGTGVVPTLSATPTSLNFGNVITGQSSEMSYDLTGDNLVDDVNISAPAGYQVSLTSGSNFASSISVTQSGGDISQTIYVKFSPTAETTYNGNISNESTDATTIYVNVAGTGVPPATPIITASLNSIDFGTVQTGTNDIQTFTVSASDLTEDLTISVTGSNYEISEDGTTFGTDNIVLAKTAAGTVNSTTIYVKFAPTAVQTYTGLVSCYSTGATQVDISLSGEGIEPMLSVSPASLSFGDVEIGNTSEMSYDLTGENLVDDVNISAPAGYQVSLTSGSNFASSVNVTQTAGNISQTIYVKFSPTAETAYNGNISNESTDASSQNVAVSGNGVQLGTPTITSSLSNIDFGNVQIGSESIQTFEISAENLTNDMSISLNGQNYEMSLDGTTFGTTDLMLNEVNGFVYTSTIYVKFTPDVAQTYSGTITASSVDANSVDVTLNGEGVEPTLVVSPETISFGDVEIGATAELSYNLNGMYLTNDVIITPPTGFMVSTQSGAGFESSLTITPDEGSINLPIYVQFSPTTDMDYNGNISNESTGASTQNVGVTGSGVAQGTPLTTIDVTELNFGEVQAGTESILTYSISGSNLTDDINITLATGVSYSISDDNVNFSTSLTLPQIDGNVLETLIYVKFAPDAKIDYNDTITHSSTGAANRQVSLSGSTTADIFEYDEVEIIVYPNPTTNIITVESQDLDIDRILIFDVAGKIIYSKTNFDNNTIDLTDYANGLYFLKIYSDKGAFVEKVIKK